MNQLARLRGENPASKIILIGDHNDYEEEYNIIEASLKKKSLTIKIRYKDQSNVYVLETSVEDNNWRSV